MIAALRSWFRGDALVVEQWRRLWMIRNQELYARWNAGLCHPLQSSAPTVKGEK